MNNMTNDPIIGVDFSGARQDNNTWMARGRLRDEGLQVTSVALVSRAELLALLQDAPAGSVASLDFPFSVPQPFAQVLAGEPHCMGDVWAAVAEMEMAEFIARRDRFVTKHGELRRQCDLSHLEAYSVLHKVNPNMLPMTFRGMQLLHQLRCPDTAILCQDPPLPARLTVLECMPGATLKGLGLPYKGYKNGQQREELRHLILDGLGSAKPVPVANLEEVRQQCQASHDALDAVAAALTSAAYLVCPEAVSTPPEEDIFRLEGWIYHIFQQ